ncbi:unnamed protein product [Cercopithifilaria johnstoni]|uniref:Uncharacterized protein n=1 Tax=Cercopithifilaria johnstoni TaxID=2874296 RepID=A0A8J2MC31_9BILA|nr:unnamed protein product [Cercopithifilaria johnstoni]
MITLLSGITVIESASSTLNFRDCYAKRQAKKNVSKLNSAFEMPNYGTCIESKQNEISKSYEIHSAVKTKAAEENERNNSNSGEIAVMDAYRMRRMFECDPSQLPAEEAPLSTQTSTDLLVIYASKSLNEPKSQICGPQPKKTIHQSRNVEEKKNSTLSEKVNKISQENKNTVEVPQKYANILAKNEETTKGSSNYNSNSTTYFYEPKNEFFEQQKLPTSISNQLMATCNQPETIPELMVLNLKGPKIDEHLETTWNQPALRNESTWVTDKELRDKSYSLASFSELSFDAANPYSEETINLELCQSNQETKRHTLKDQLDYHQEPESSDCFAKDDKPIHFIQESRTIHQIDNWSSESDYEEDVYHRLSEAEEEGETERSPEFVAVSCTEKVKDFMEDPAISQNEKNFGINLDMQSFVRPKQFKVCVGEPCYKQQESPLPSNSLNMSSTSDNLTPEEFVSFAPIDDLK